MLGYGFMQNAVAISVLIGALCPCIGVFLVLRRHSMIGDTLSHASLAGVAIGLLAGVSPLLTAFLFAVAAGALIEFLRGYFKKNMDLVLSIVLALGVGVAITIISTGRLRANAESFLFGSVLTVSSQEVALVAVISAASLLLISALYHQLLYLTFDEEASKIAGVKVRLLGYVFSILVAAAVSVAIRVVGVLVVSSMIALPVAAALQFEKGFRATTALSVLISLADILLGLFLSYRLDAAPGGLTALVSVAVLGAVLASKKLARLRRLSAAKKGGKKR